MRRRAVIGLLGVALMVVSCSDKTGGDAQEAQSAPAVTTTVPPTPHLVAASTADEALLKRSELGDIIGDTDLRQVEAYTKPWQSSEGVEPRDCAPRLLFNEAVAAAGYQLAVGDTNRGARGQIAQQLITVFDNRDQPANPCRGRCAATGGTTAQLLSRDDGACQRRCGVHCLRRRRLREPGQRDHRPDRNEVPGVNRHRLCGRSAPQELGDKGFQSGRRVGGDGPVCFGIGHRCGVELGGLGRLVDGQLGVVSCRVEPMTQRGARCACRQSHHIVVGPSHIAEK
jgi:hypothetical protein